MTVHGNRYCLNHTDHIVILTGTKKREERQIRNSFKKCYERYGWDGVYSDLKRKGHTRIYSGMIYAAKRMGLVKYKKTKKKSRKHRRYPELLYL